jgi:hypothetical protein
LGRAVDSSSLKIEAACSSEIVNFTRLHGITSQKAGIFLFETAVHAITISVQRKCGNLGPENAYEIHTSLEWYSGSGDLNEFDDLLTEFMVIEIWKM